jgi:DNA-binding IclR family transcriptional regulator
MKLLNMKNNSHSLAPALSRGLEVLEALTSDPSGMTLAELSTKLGIPSASLWRISRVLTEKGFITFDSHKRIYRLGLKLMSMGNIFFSNGYHGTIAREDLKRLSEKTGETVELNIQTGEKLVIVDQVPGPGEIFLSSRPGSVLPYLHATAPGKVYLSHLEKKQLRNFVDRIGLPSLTKNTIDTLKHLENELKQISLEGYATELEEMREGISKVAAPIYNSSKKIKACIAVVCPAFKLRKQNRRVLYGELVKSTAAEMTKRYGEKI